jgi:hypothetical protein
LPNPPLKDLSLPTFLSNVFTHIFWRIKHYGY